jgi:hypothetical protein
MSWTGAAIDSCWVVRKWRSFSAASCLVVQVVVDTRHSRHAVPSRRVDDRGGVAKMGHLGDGAHRSCFEGEQECKRRGRDFDVG